MISYTLSRFTYYLSLFLGIILLSFILFHVVPSDPTRVILGPNADQEQVKALRQKLGIDQPLYIQLFRYLSNVSKLEFGHSYVDRRNVLSEVMSRIKITLTLTAISLLFILLYLSSVVGLFVSRSFR